jgi:hypothetical protein
LAKLEVSGVPEKRRKIWELVAKNKSKLSLFFYVSIYNPTVQSFFCERKETEVFQVNK